MLDLVILDGTSDYLCGPNTFRAVLLHLFRHPIGARDRIVFTAGDREVTLRQSPSVPDDGKIHPGVPNA